MAIYIISNLRDKADLSDLTNVLVMAQLSKWYEEGLLSGSCGLELNIGDLVISEKDGRSYRIVAFREDQHGMPQLVLETASGRISTAKPGSVRFHNI